MNEQQWINIPRDRIEFRQVWWASGWFVASYGYDAYLITNSGATVKLPPEDVDVPPVPTLSWAEVPVRVSYRTWDILRENGFISADKDSPVYISKPPPDLWAYARWAVYAVIAAGAMYLIWRSGVFKLFLRDWRAKRDVLVNLTTMRR